MDTKRSPSGGKNAKKPNEPTRPNARRVALRALRRIDGGAFSDIVSDISLDRARAAGMSAVDAALASRLIRGVTERRITLDYIASTLSSRPLSRIDDETKCILRIGLYQLAYCDRIPPHAAVSETVSLARGGSRGFCNALFREYLRRTEDGTRPYPLPERGRGEGELCRCLSIRYSVCEGLVRELLAAYGEARTEAMLSASLEPPPLTLRTNTLRTTREELIKSINAEGLSAEPATLSPHGIKVRGGLPSCLSGESPAAFVEDEAAQLAVKCLSPRPGERVLDACAAPGGKSISAAMMMEDRGEILACELQASRLPLITAAAAAQGVSIIRTCERDSSAPLPEGYRGYFDRVLCDVPCSGYGTIRRKPEIRYRDPAECADLPALGAAILKASSAGVRPGGVLVYSTCTILPRENEDVVRAFLASHDEFEPIPISISGIEGGGDGMLTLTTDMPHGGDGFFIAAMRRRDAAEVK